MRRKKDRKKHFPLGLIKRIKRELGEICEEWGGLEAEDIDSRISEALSSGIMNEDLSGLKWSVRRQLKKGPRLSEFFHLVVENSELSERAEYFESLTNLYVDDVDEDDLSEAFELLQELIMGLDNVIGEFDVQPEQPPLI